MSQLEIQGDGNLSFEDGISGRAEESNWTVSINGEGLIVALAQGSGEPIQPGEGILTRIQLNLENISILSGSLKIIDVEASGYFGRQLSFETGEPTTFELLITNEELIIPTKIMNVRHFTVYKYVMPFIRKLSSIFGITLPMTSCCYPYICCLSIIR